MKKLLALMLALGMTVSLAACGGTDSADTASEAETTEESAETADAAEDTASENPCSFGMCCILCSRM